MSYFNLAALRHLCSLVEELRIQKNECFKSLSLIPTYFLSRSVEAYFLGLVLFLMKLFMGRLSSDLEAVGPGPHPLSKPAHDKSRRIERSAREIKRESKFVGPVS